MKPFSSFFALKAVHPDAVQAADGSLDVAQQGGYRVAERHQDLYRGSVFRRTPNMLSHAEVLKQKPAWTEVFKLRESGAKAVLAALKVGEEEIREGIGLLARTTGIFTETAGGVTVAVLAKLAERGDIDPAERVVVYITGDGLKTLDCARGTFETWEIDPTVASFDQARERLAVAA